MGWRYRATPWSMGQHNKRNGGRCRNQMMHWNHTQRLNISSTQVASGVALLSLHNFERLTASPGQGPSHPALGRQAGGAARQRADQDADHGTMLPIMAAAQDRQKVLVGKVQCNPPATGPEKNARRRQCHPANPSIPQQVNTHLLQAAAHRPLHHRSSHHGRLRLRLVGEQCMLRFVSDGAAIPAGPSSMHCRAAQQQAGSQQAGKRSELPTKCAPAAGGDPSCPQT